MKSLVRTMVVTSLLALLGACTGESGGKTSPEADAGGGEDVISDDTISSEDAADDDVADDAESDTPEPDAELCELTVCGEDCVDTDTDLAHCGGCDLPCEATENATATCADAVCTVTCEDGFYDLDGEPGCEYACDGTGDGSETCNGLDDDCDGLTDADDPDFVAEACPAQDGVCAGTVANCVDGELEACPDVYAALADYETVETACDALDNDCDGAADSLDADFEPRLCPQQRGVCEGALEACSEAGEVICDAAVYAAAAGDGIYAEGPELWCDGLDDNCDGEVDEACCEATPAIFEISPADLRTNPFFQQAFVRVEDEIYAFEVGGEEAGVYRISRLSPTTMRFESLRETPELNGYQGFSIVSLDGQLGVWGLDREASTLGRVRFDPDSDSYDFVDIPLGLGPEYEIDRASVYRVGVATDEVWVVAEVVDWAERLEYSVLIRIVDDEYVEFAPIGTVDTLYYRQAFAFDRGDRVRVYLIEPGLEANRLVVWDFSRSFESIGSTEIAPNIRLPAFGLTPVYYGDDGPVLTYLRADGEGVVVVRPNRIEGSVEAIDTPPIGESGALVTEDLSGGPLIQRASSDSVFGATVLLTGPLDSDISAQVRGGGLLATAAFEWRDRHLFTYAGFSTATDENSAVTAVLTFSPEGTALCDPGLVLSGE